MKLPVALAVAVLFATRSYAAPAAGGNEAAYRFAVAKALAGEGSFVEALAAFEEAEKAAPADPYIRIEHALLLARLVQISRSANTGIDYLDRAAAEIEEARRAAPENLDVLRAAGQVYLQLAARRPAAVATAREALEAVRRRDPADLQSLVALGQIYMDEGKPAEAAEVFRELVRTVPGNRIPYGFLVEALLKAGRQEEAEAALGELLAVEPDSVESRLTLAEIQSRRGDHAAALATLQGAPPEALADPRIARQLASARYLAGDLEGALAATEPLLKADPKDPYLNRLKGLVLAALGRNREAIEVLGRLHEAEPDDLALASTLSRVLERDGRREDAARVLSRLADDLARDGSRAEDARQTRLELAQLLYDARDWEKARAALEPLLGAADPASRNAALPLAADILMELGRREEALALLSAEGKPDGERSGAVAGKRAEVLLRLGRDEEARAEIERMAAAGDAQGLVLAAQVYQRAERYPESLPWLLKALAKQPDLAPVHFLLGAARERTGDREGAAAAFRRALELEPDFHAALNYLGYMWVERGEHLSEALGLVQRAVALDPDNGAYVDSLGWAHFQLRQYDQARTFLERAVRLLPDDATTNEHLGDVYRALGEKARAREVYRRALALNDDNAEQVRHKLDGLDQVTPQR